MCERANVLLIENQSLQYNTICEMLCSHYNVFPEEGDYERFIDWVRIFANLRYKTAHLRNSRRDDAFDFIIKFIDANKIVFLIIDYKLTGFADGGSGIFLAKAIREKRDLPILFLSRMDRNEQSVMEELEKLTNDGFENFGWIEKGFAGSGLGNQAYYDNHVLKKIEALLDNELTEVEKKPRYKDVEDLLKFLSGISYLDKERADYDWQETFAKASKLDPNIWTQTDSTLLSDLKHTPRNLELRKKVQSMLEKKIRNE